MSAERGNERSFRKILLFFIVFSFAPPLPAEEFLWVEILPEDRQTLHFVYSAPSANAVFYYAAWIANKDQCPEFGDQALALQRIDNRYLPPKTGGYLCLAGSDKQLMEEWERYRIMPEKDGLLDDEDDIRSVSDDSGEVLPERRKKQCVFALDAEKGIKFCILSL